MTESFSAHLRRLADRVWQAQLEHPFVRGIADGTVDIERFRFWLRQDYRFLIEYCRLFALAAARSPDLETLTRFADLLQATAGVEMQMHRSFAAEFGITTEDLEAESMAPTTQAYTDFLIRTAATQDFAELAAALLPCMWAYAEIGLKLGGGPRPTNSRFAAWIDSYADAHFQALAEWCRQLVDRLGEEASPATRRRMEAAFLTSSRHELAFWEMAWTLQTWGDA
jgi:thiaminase (transcriptional activator TenA)